MASLLRNLPIRTSCNLASCSLRRTTPTTVAAAAATPLYRFATSPAFPAAATTTRTTTHTFTRTMATADAPKKMEWLVVVPDFAGAQEKRLAVRPEHFANLGPPKESGLIVMGGAVLHDVPTSDDPKTFAFAGSTLVISAASRDEVKQVLLNDVYAKKGVWDVENAQIWPFLCAFRREK